MDTQCSRRVQANSTIIFQKKYPRSCDAWVLRTVAEHALQSAIADDAARRSTSYQRAYAPAPAMQENASRRQRLTIAASVHNACRIQSEVVQQFPPLAVLDVAIRYAQTIYPASIQPLRIG